MMIDIEEELKKAQIKYIQKELEQLRQYYSGITDLEFLHILCGYEEMLEIAVTTDERLLLYKKMYQNRGKVLAVYNFMRQTIISYLIVLKERLTMQLI